MNPHKIEEIFGVAWEDVEDEIGEEDVVPPVEPVPESGLQSHGPPVPDQLSPYPSSKNTSHLTYVLLF